MIMPEERVEVSYLRCFLATVVDLIMPHLRSTQVGIPAKLGPRKSLIRG